MDIIPEISCLRLKQLARYRTVAYSKVIRVTCHQESKFILTVYPDHFNGAFKINLSQPGTEIHILDAMGKPVLHQ